MYEYLGKLVKVVDADTIDVDIDVGFKIRMTHRLRLNLIDAPERYTPHGKDLTQKVKEWFKSYDESYLKVRTFKSDSFGRYLADVWSYDDDMFNRDSALWRDEDPWISLNDWLLEQPHVKLWRKR